MFSNFQVLNFSYYDATTVFLMKVLKDVVNGQRIYVNSQTSKVLDGLGISMLSASKGVISNKTALKLNVGGELLCEVF